MQSQGADQIREAMVRLSEGAGQTSISLREFNKATDHLREAVGGLKEEVSRFTLGRFRRRRPPVRVRETTAEIQDVDDAIDPIATRGTEPCCS